MGLGIYRPAGKKCTGARNDYDEEAAYDDYMNPEPGFQPGPGDSVDADKMAPCLLVTKSSPPRWGGLRKKRGTFPPSPQRESRLFPYMARPTDKASSAFRPPVEGGSILKWGLPTTWGGYRQ